MFFLAHRDAEKTTDMVATLVVLLPASFRGGASVITHERERVVVPGGSTRDLTFIAFFADCAHEVKPVTSGHRVALTYELRLSGKPAARPQDPSVVREIRELVDDHFDTPVPMGYRREDAAPDRLVYLLDHQYTPRGLSWRRLKGTDAARAATLRSVADDADCEVQLATAEVHEKWGCEPEVDYGRRRWRGRRHDYEETTSDDHPPLTELFETTVVLDHFLDASDRPTRAPGSAVQPGELCFSRPSDELTPFEVEHEGYQGNWGDTVDRWYRRAAIVLWRRSRAFIVRGKHDAPWAAARIREQADAGHVETARAMVTQLLPHFGPRVKAATSAALAADVLHVAAALDDPELAARFVAPLSLEHVAVPTALAALVDGYGEDWVEARFDDWTDAGVPAFRRRPIARGAWQVSLPKLAKAFADEPVVRKWLRRRLERERIALGEALESAASLESPSYAERAFAELRDPYLAVLRAATIAEAKRVHDALTRALARSGDSNTRAWAVEVLRAARKALTAAELEQADLAPVAKALAGALRAELDAGVRRPGDWSIRVPLRCTCALCVELAAFLESEHERALDWPLAKQRRQHIHGQIDRHELPVTHTTRRQGSPYTLMLRKTEALFAEDEAARARVRTQLAYLETWGSQSPRKRRQPASRKRS